MMKWNLNTNKKSFLLSSNWCYNWLFQRQIVHVIIFYLISSLELSLCWCYDSPPGFQLRSRTPEAGYPRSQAWFCHLVNTINVGILLKYLFQYLKNWNANFFHCVRIKNNSHIYGSIHLSLPGTIAILCQLSWNNYY